MPPAFGRGALNNAAIRLSVCLPTDKLGRTATGNGGNGNKAVTGAVSIVFARRLHHRYAFCPLILLLVFSFTITLLYRYFNISSLTCVLLPLLLCIAFYSFIQLCMYSCKCVLLNYLLTYLLISPSNFHSLEAYRLAEQYLIEKF